MGDAGVEMFRCPCEDPAADGQEPDDVFSELQIASRDALHACTDRFTCRLTQRSFMFYSYNCFNPDFYPKLAAMTSQERRATVLGDYWQDKVPEVKLPLPLHIIHHRGEKLSKATGVHALVLAPSTTHIHHFPDLPPCDPSEAVMLFSTPDAVPQSELSDEDFAKVKAIYVIDSTWQQSTVIRQDPRLANVRCITISPQKTKFWRYQNIGQHCLSTIECSYYTYKEYLERRDGSYSGQLDNLLFYFCMFYEKIQRQYTSGDKAAMGRTYTKRHAHGESYIQGPQAAKKPRKESEASSKEPEVEQEGEA